MRILKTTQTYYPYLSKGGPPAKVRAIARGLVRLGHQVTVLTADLGNQEQEQEQGQTAGAGGGNSKQRLSKGWESLEDGVEAIYLKTIQNYRATTINPHILSFCARRVREYDVVHIYGLYDLIGSTTAWFCRRRRIPYVLEPLGMFGPKVRSQNKKQLYRKLVGDALFDGASLVIANSETERHELIEGGISETRIVLRRNGIDLSEFQTLPAPGAFRAKRNIDARTPLVLFLGRISFIKGLDYLVEAFADIADSFPQARLIIAGPDDADGCAQAIRTIVDQRQLTKQITSIGALYGKERLEAFIDADFVVLPSRYESFGNVAAESIACGTPVLVTDTCGIASLVDGAGLVVSSDGLRDGLKRLLGEEDLLAKLRAGCVRVASNLSWDEPINEMEKLYASVIAERAVHAKKTNSEPHWTVSSEP